MEWMNSNLKEIGPTNISNQEQKEKIAKEIANCILLQSLLLMK